MTIAYFTPSMNDPALLEAIFTAREWLARELIDNIRDSVSSGSRQYSLVTGPRGIGKTHLISLVYYRLKSDPSLNDRLRIAWLLEDAWSIGSYAHLLREILDRLDKEYTLPNWARRLNEIQTVQNERARESLMEGDILTFLDGRVLLIVAENLDTIFEGLGEEGQARLRAFLQTKAPATILATAPSLLPELQAREKPFFGFFRDYPLAPFTFQECVKVMVRIANYKGDDALAELLASPRGRSRIRAIHHIAGGHPRIYVIFYQFITCESLEDLVAPFMKMVDDLVPYYQNRMQTLSAQQRMLVDIIRRNESPIAVRDIAAAAFITSQSASSDLSRLRELGYVTHTKVGREGLYELREPLMRICLAAKEQRGGSLPLLIDFLRVWFTPSELRDLHIPEKMVDRKKYEAAVREGAKRQGAQIAYEMNEIVGIDLAGRSEEALVRLKRLYERTPEPSIWLALSMRLRSANDYATLARYARDRVEMFPDSAEEWNLLDYAEFCDGRPEAALAASRRSISLAPQTPGFWVNHLTNLRQLGEREQLREAALAALAANTETDTEDYWHLRSICDLTLENYSATVSAAMRAILLLPGNFNYWRLLHVALQHLLADRARLITAEHLVTVLPGTSGAWLDLSLANLANGRFDEAMAAIDRALALAPGDPDLLGMKLHYAIWLGDRDAADSTAALIDLPEGADLHPDLLAVIAEFHAISDHPDAPATLDTLAKAIVAHQATDRILPPVAMMKWSADTRSFARIASLWASTFARHDLLVHLGRELATSLFRPATLAIPLAVVGDWVEAWADLSRTHPELVIPVALMRVAVSYRETPDQRVLMELPVEQRALIAPHIDRVSAALGKTENPMIAEVETFLASLESDARTDMEQGASENRFVLPVNPTGARALFAEYDSDADIQRPLRRLYGGEWRSVGKAAARAILKKLLATEIELIFMQIEGVCRLLKLERTTLPFSRGHLYQAHFRVKGRIGAFDFWHDGEEAVLLSGHAGAITGLIAKGAFEMNAQTEPSVLKLYTNSLRAEEGRFELVTPDDPIVPAIERQVPGVEIAHPRRSQRDNIAVYTSHMVYDDRLMEVELSYSKDDNLFTMLADRPLSEGPLDLGREEFKGPIRYWADDHEEGVG